MKNFTGTVLILSIVFLSFHDGLAQNRKQQIEASRSAYLTTRMNLSVEASQAFWPIYNKMHQEIRNLKENFRNNIIKGRQEKDLNDNELKQLILARFDMEQKELDLKRKYHSEFEKVLSIRQVAILYRAEEDFKREVIREIQRRR